MPPLIGTLLEPAELANIYQRLMQLPVPPQRARLGKDEWLGGLGVFIVVFLSTFPVAIPFIFMHEVGLALRVSNAIAIVMLFLLGYAFGTMTGRRPWLVGIAMVLLGVRARRHDDGARRLIPWGC